MFQSDFKKEKVSLVVCLLALFYLFFKLMQPFVMTITLSIIFVVMFYPLFAQLQIRTGKPRVSAFLVTAAIFFIILLPATLIVTLVVNQSITIVGQVNIGEFFQNTILPIANRIRNSWPIALDLNIIGLLTDIATQVAASISNFSPKLFFGTANFFFNFFIMLVSIYFLFLEGPNLSKLFYSISPMRDSHERRLLKEVKNTIDACVHGYLLTSLVQAVLASFAFWISGIPGFAVLGMMTFFMSLVPVVGAAGIWVPVCIFLFLNDQTGIAVFNLIWGALVVSGIDNVLKPLIIQGKTRIHPLLVFFSLFGGIIWFGPLGILFGPVITAVLIATIKIYRDEIVSTY